jgi:hypothetical protein
VTEFSDAMLSSAQDHFDEAEQHLATLASLVQDYAIPRGEAGCLIGFAKVALDQGDYARASRLLGSVNSSVGPEGKPVLSTMDAVIYFQCTELLRDALDPDTARVTQAEGAALSLKEALEAELIRCGTTAVANPAD